MCEKLLIPCLYTSAPTNMYCWFAAAGLSMLWQQSMRSCSFSFTLTYTCTSVCCCLQSNLASARSSQAPAQDQQALLQGNSMPVAV